MKPALLLPLLAATSALPQPGLWEMTGAPGQATLDGRALGDLPYTPPAAADRQCLTRDEARDPVTLIARQVPEGCTVAARTVSAHGVTLTGSCRPQASGLARGTFRLVGDWSSTRYGVRFSTSNPSENGVMGFSGRVDARRVGSCS